MTTFDLGDPFDFLPRSRIIPEIHQGLTEKIYGNVWLLTTRHRARCKDIDEMEVLRFMQENGARARRDGRRTGAWSNSSVSPGRS